MQNAKLDFLVDLKLLLDAKREAEAKLDWRRVKAGISVRLARGLVLSRAAPLSCGVRGSDEVSLYRLESSP